MAATAKASPDRRYHGPRYPHPVPDGRWALQRRLGRRWQTIDRYRSRNAAGHAGSRVDDQTRVVDLDASPLRLSLDALAATLAVPVDEVARLATVLGVTRRTVHRWKADGLSLDQAERACDAVGDHPAAVWCDDYTRACLAGTE